MEIIENLTLDEERALYGKEEITVRGCRFDGPMDGESALKECGVVHAQNCYFNLRYPMWHNEEVTVEDCELTPLCRAALWYSSNISIYNSKLYGTKALRECSYVHISNSNISSDEFGWMTNGVNMRSSFATGEYFMFRAINLYFTELTFKGKYSFQYVENAIFENCAFDTKDAFWHAKNVRVKNSVIKGEYLGWYCEDVTFENCVIIGTQPLCYCKNLRLVNCKMQECDLAFEKSSLEAEITSHIDSIKNPRAGYIKAPSLGELIIDGEEPEAKIFIGEAIV